MFLAADWMKKQTRYLQKEIVGVEREEVLQYCSYPDIALTPTCNAWFNPARYVEAPVHWHIRIMLCLYSTYHLLALMCRDVLVAREYTRRGACNSITTYSLQHARPFRPDFEVCSPSQHVAVLKSVPYRTAPDNIRSNALFRWCHTLY